MRPYISPVLSGKRIIGDLRRCGVALALLLSTVSTAFLSAPQSASAAQVVLLTTSYGVNVYDPSDLDNTNINSADTAFSAAAAGQTPPLSYDSHIGVLTTATAAADISQYVGDDTQVLVLVGVYNMISDAALAQIATYLQTRPGMEVIAFVDGCDNCGTATGSVNLNNFLTAIKSIQPSTWGTITVGPVSTAATTVSNLNTASPYSAPFTALGLNSITGVIYPPLLGVPASNALYLVNGNASDAFSVFIPQGQSNGGDGACMFLATDSNVFQGRFAPQPAEIAQAFLNAALTPTGACGLPPTVTVTKTASTTDALTPGGSVSYTITVTNISAKPAANVVVSDTPPSGIASFDSWSCADNTGGTTCPSLGTTGAFPAQTIASLPAGAQVVYTINATAAATLPASVKNTASVTGADLVCASGQTQPCTADVSNPYYEADMQGSGAATITPLVGTEVTVKLTCKNAGPDDAVNAECTLGGVPGGVTPTCTLDGVGAAVTLPVATLAEGHSIVCAVTFTPASTTAVTLTATATSDTPDVNHNNDKGTAAIRPTGLGLGVTAAAIPTLGQSALALLALLLAAGAATGLRRARKHN